jgi:hypothetical protein
MLNAASYSHERFFDSFKSFAVDICQIRNIPAVYKYYARTLQRLIGNPELAQWFWLGAASLTLPALSPRPRKFRGLHSLSVVHRFDPTSGP